MKKLSNFQKLLALFFAFILAMITCRILYSGSYQYIFLLWNLFLAWVPFKISLYLTGKNSNNKIVTGSLLMGWLLFFPNALYIITDLIHLEGKTEMPVWYDAILLFTSAIAGLLMAFGSLYKVEKFLGKKIGVTTTTKLMVLCLFMGSFGVYLGRFLRWNSWDIITNPFGLGKEIVIRFLFPVEYYRTWAVTFLFTSFFCLLYFMVKSLTIYGVKSGNQRHIPGEKAGLI